MTRRDPSPSTAHAIQSAGREDGDSPTRGNAWAVEGGGSWAPRSASLMGWIGRGSRAGVPVVGRLPGRVLLATVAALGLALLARDARALAGQLERAGLDSRGVCIVIGRLKAQHAAESWARVLANVAKVEAGL